MKQEVNIKGAAKILGVHVDTIKYWEEKALIPTPRRNENNSYRVYDKPELLEIAKARGMYAVEVESAWQNYFMNKY
jgi:DNA-binding transcriptional MerR regulator